MRRPHLFTSESVTEGHPDKVADQISDAVLDACLARDPLSRVACETLVTKDNVVIAGEISDGGGIDVEAIARDTIRRIGYDRPDEGFSADTCRVQVFLQRQSGDIGRGVDTGGAGDQGLVFGYACDETPELMPLPIALAHRLARRLAGARRDGTLPWARPDGKTQVTVEYEGDTPVRVDTVVVSTQHEADVSQTEVEAAVRKHAIDAVIPRGLRDGRETVHVNPTGRFVEGGPAADTGLTGRKIVVDTYGGAAPHGGGAFSGKDPTKVDRSAAYAARQVAKSLVAAGLARRALVQLAYAIGVAEPVSVLVRTFGTSEVSEEELVGLVRRSFPLTPSGMIEALGLRAPIYLPTAAYGHFGRAEAGFPWEAALPLVATRGAA